MKTKPLLLIGSLPVVAVALYAGWHFASSASNSPELNSNQLPAVPTSPVRPLTSPINAPHDSVGLPVANATSEFPQLVQMALNGELTVRKRADAVAAVLATASQAQADDYLRQVIAAVGNDTASTALLLATTSKGLSDGCAQCFVNALTATGEQGQLPEAVEAAVFKALRTESAAQLVGNKLVARWNAEPTSVLRSRIESLDNPWFYSGTAVLAQEHHDDQLLQESLIRLETCNSPSTPAAVMALSSDSRIVPQLSTTLQGWVARQSDSAAAANQLATLFNESTDPTERSLVAGALATSADHTTARTALGKALATSREPTERTMIAQALQHIGTAPAR